MKKILPLVFIWLIVSCNTKQPTEKAIAETVKKELEVGDSLVFSANLPVAKEIFYYSDLIEAINANDGALMSRLVWAKKITFADSGNTARITHIDKEQFELRLLDGKHGGEKVYAPKGFFDNKHH